jgi:hypothetical protein
MPNDAASTAADMATNAAKMNNANPIARSACMLRASATSVPVSMRCYTGSIWRVIAFSLRKSHAASQRLALRF